MSSSLSILNKILSVILIIVVSVELPEWKPDCSYSSIIANCFPEDILVETLLDMLLRILDRIVSTDMGR